MGLHSGKKKERFRVKAEAIKRWSGIIQNPLG